MTTPAPQEDQWLMQPRWVPALRAGIGLLLAGSAVAALVLVRPWRAPALALILAWLALGIFLVWASRFERSGTRLEADAITVVEGRRPRRLTRADILALRGEPPQAPWRLQAVLRDGRTVTLLGVPPGELERLRRWHSGV
ncbi:hypothetical protein [Ornithinimicrobium cerasi]|uniref:PH domain-containing protein n=1 Tax=Ornithinimicrobium cerasi TaxID=2248773 RepID=A0A285VTV5_9MICO|nr:hypothetical protein [Ornithinimicrobium cerasi]SOC56061.1 hypothetical protein SAMN05421879_106184 [Ornithinimicrobium cerasi]